MVRVDDRKVVTGYKERFLAAAVGELSSAMQRLSGIGSFVSRFRAASVLWWYVERARRLHPWIGEQHQYEALIDEVRELRDELDKAFLGDGAYDRVRAEALDVAVVALRIVAGR